MWDLVTWPGIQPGPPALGALSLNHWSTRKIPRLLFKKQNTSALCLRINRRASLGPRGPPGSVMQSCGSAEEPLRPSPPAGERVDQIPSGKATAAAGLAWPPPSHHWASVIKAAGGLGHRFRQCWSLSMEGMTQRWKDTNARYPMNHTKDEDTWSVGRQTKGKLLKKQVNKLDTLWLVKTNLWTT